MKVLALALAAALVAGTSASADHRSHTFTICTPTPHVEKFDGAWEYNWDNRQWEYCWETKKPRHKPRPKPTPRPSPSIELTDEQAGLLLFFGILNQIQNK